MTRILVIAASLLVAATSLACGAADGRATGAQSRLLDGGVAAFERELASLKGKPVVVNQWASWCGPCRFEFPFFADLSKRYESQVAFLGVNSKDARDSAERFLNEQPVPYKHFYDPDTKIARTFRGGRTWPTTAFYTREGKRSYTHFGAYKDRADLDADIRRYAVDG